MPGVAFHLLCAHRVLQRWRCEPSFRSTGLHDPRVVEAFLHGALGPDMGYFAPGLRRVSDLVHRSQCGDLARSLVAEAAGPLQQAYAWGWVTHILADVAAHPLINLAAGELVGSAAEGTPAEHLAAHIRVEMGLDAYIAARTREVRAGALGRGFAGDEGFIVAALQRTYGPVVHAEDVARGHNSLRVLVPWLLTLGDVSARVGSIGRRWIPRFRKITPDRRGGSPPLAGTLVLAGAFLSPVLPRPWLLAAVRRLTRGFAEEFLMHVQTGLRELGNHDLDTGAPSEEREPSLAEDHQAATTVPAGA